MSEKTTGKRMILTAGFIAAATLLSKVLGLVRDSMLGAYFGAGMESDAFLTASTIPTTLFDVIIGGVISAAFIPVFNRIIADKSREEADSFVNKYITIILLITIAVSVFGIIFRAPLVGLMAPNYEPEKAALAANLTAIMFPMIIFTGLAFSFVGVLQSFGEYNIPAVISLVSNTAIIFYYVLFGKKFGIYGLAVTMVIAWSLQVLVQVPWIRKFGVKYRPDFRFRDDNIKSALKLAGPMLVATWVQPLYTVINQRLASNIGSAVSYIQLSSRLYLIVTGVVSFVVTNLIFPKLSKAVADKNMTEAKSLVVISVKAMFLIILPMMAGFMLLSEPVASIIYGHGEMTAGDIVSISALLKFYSIGMAGLAVNEVLSKTFFSLGDSKTPMRTSIISMIINIALAYILYSKISTNGLALATACGSISNAVLNWVFLQRKHPGLFGKSDALSIVKMLVSAVIMGAAVYGVYTAVSGMTGKGFAASVIQLAAGVAAGVVVYAVCALVLKIDMVKKLTDEFIKR